MGVKIIVLNYIMIMGVEKSQAHYLMIFVNLNHIKINVVSEDV